MDSPTFWLIAAAAVAVAGLSKSGLLGGLGLASVPLLSLVMPARDAAGLMLPLLLVMDAISVWNYRREANWDILKILLPGAAIGTLLGWLMWSVVTDAFVNLMVGVITLLFVADALLPLRKKLEGLPPSKPWGTFWGGVAGFTSFISHTGGAPFQIYTLPRRMSPVMYSGTSAFFFAIVNTAKLAPYFFLGQLNVSNMTHAALLVPVAILSVMLGVVLVRRISIKQFYAIAYTLVGMLAIKLVYDGITGVFFAAPAS
ncbi:MAG TPA: sulfite exporter TauE/SafE family protein [Devosia sp.]|nr:sulfite exporter TauE/SafE family protein [Devosia sp.]